MARSPTMNELKEGNLSDLNLNNVIHTYANFSEFQAYFAATLSTHDIEGGKNPGRAMGALIHGLKTIFSLIDVPHWSANTYNGDKHQAMIIWEACRLTFLKSLYQATVTVVEKKKGKNKPPKKTFMSIQGVEPIVSTLIGNLGFDDNYSPIKNFSDKKKFFDTDNDAKTFFDKAANEAKERSKTLFAQNNNTSTNGNNEEPNSDEDQRTMLENVIQNIRIESTQEDD